MSLSVSRPLAGIASVLCCAAQAASPSPAGNLEPVVVTAARAEQPLSNALGDVSVIDAETLRNAGQSSLAELLQSQYGVDIATNGGPQTTTSVFLRGANSAHTVFLIDGQRVGSSSAGGAGINAIGLADVERIEILRGPASGLYGADAIGGVVNIITRRPAADRPLEAHGSAGIGSWNTRKADAGLSGSSGMWRYALSAGHASSDGFNATKPTEPGGLFDPDRDGYREDHAAGRLGLTWADGQDIEASFLRSRLNGQYDGGDGFDDRMIQKTESYSLASTNRIARSWTSRLRVGRTIDDNVSLYAPSAFDPAGRGAFRTRQTLFSWQNDFALAAGQSLSVAAERREEDVDGTTAFDPSSRNTNSLVGVYRADLSAHHIQGNLRYDHVAAYGSRVTGGLFYGYDLSPAWQATAAASTGFRLPTFNDLYYPIYGNPDLGPESSRNVEAGLRYHRGNVEAGVQAYRNKIDNLVVYQNPFAVNKDAVIKGITLNAAARLGATSLRASLDVTDPEDRNTGQTLTRRARQALKLAAEHRVAGWLLGAEWLASGSRLDTAYNASSFSNETYRLGGYSLLNLTASYDLTRQLRLQVRWNNVTDKDYEFARGYATPGSNVFVSLSYQP
ncbi:TonB-dependent receptor [Pigmentiphaga soli]|uniref:TonB-dependent receptor n=1 Tax=Pigmentiphaga soli TaxID=1007095 RepID=A0ABP8HP91_9BURK